jgi:hypothetical protein
MILCIFISILKSKLTIPNMEYFRMKKSLAVAAVLAILALGIPPRAESWVISPLVALPSTGVQIPQGTDIRMYSAPLLLGSVFFDGTSTDAYMLSSDPSYHKLITTDSAGNAATFLDSAVLAGISSRGGIMYGDHVVVAIDYWPDGGASYPALDKIARDGTWSEWTLSQGHGGAGSIIAGVKNSLFLPAALPAGVSVQTGMTAKVLKSNYTFGPIGNLFFGPDGSLYAFTSSANRKMLAKIMANGASSTAAVSDVLVGQNFRGGALYDNGYVVSVDYAPDAGNTPGGIYTMNSDGAYTAWNLTLGHGGISDLIPAPQGGYLFTDFESDNIWHITTPEAAVTPLLTTSPVALMSVAANDGGDIYAVNWIPGEWWSNGGVNAVYRKSGDTMELVAQAPEGSQLFSIAAAKGGIFGNSFYVTDTTGGRVLRVESNNTLTPVITGLPNPGRIKFDPISGNMVVVCNGQYIVWFGEGLTPFTAQAESAETQKGFYFSDFENDNVWFVQSEGKNEIPILESNVPPGLGTITYNDLNDTIYALNWTGGWPFGGEDSVYEIGSNGVATQVIKGNFSSIAMSKGGVFGKALYLSDSQGGRIVKLENGSTSEVISGLPSPGAISFDPISGNMAVVCDGGKSVAWIGANLESPASGDPGTVGTFFVPGEQDVSLISNSSINKSEVSLSLLDSRPAGYSAVSKKALTGDFEITASIRMSQETLQSGQNRDATFTVVSDVAGQKTNQCYIGFLQKTVGYAATGNQYGVYTDMNINGGWGRFNSRLISGEPFRTFKIARKNGVISTYYLENDVWVKLSTATDGFNDRVRVFFSIDTAWEASLGVAHSAVFNAIDLGEANPTVPSADFNGDGFVSLSDLVLLGTKWGLTSASPDFLVKYDLNKDGSIGLGDLVLLGNQWTAPGKVAKGAPSGAILDLSAARNEAASMFSVNVRAKDATGIDGVAFSLKYDANLFEFLKNSVAGLGTISLANEATPGVIDIASVYAKEQFSGAITLGFKSRGGTSDLNMAMTNTEVLLNGVIGSVNDRAVSLKAQPLEYALHQNAPNPFNPSTAISFTLAKAGKTTVEVFNVAGQKVDTLVNGSMSAGSHSVTWDASKFSAGLYFCTIRSGEFTHTMKMMLLK